MKKGNFSWKLQILAAQRKDFLSLLLPYILVERTSHACAELNWASRSSLVLPLLECFFQEMLHFMCACQGTVFLCVISYSWLISRGEGTGDGVVRAVLGAVIETMIADDRFWCCGLDENYYSLAPRLESSPSRRIQIKAYGTLVMMAIFHGISPDPISPFLLASVLEGDHVLQDNDFIVTVAPLTAPAFLNWPVDGSSIPATTAIQSLLANVNIEVLLSH